MSNKLWFALATAAVSSLVIGTSAAQAVETFSIDNIALNTNSSFRLINGHPRMSIFKRNDSDPDQQFDRMSGNRGGTLLKHRSTGKCLNAHYVSSGAEINVWPCDPNDPDQNWNLDSVSDGRILIKRTGTNLCVDTPTRNNLGNVILWGCDGNNPNQRWRSSAVQSPINGKKFNLTEYYQRLYGHTQAASSRQWEQHKAIDSNVVGNASKAVRALVGGEVIHMKNGVKLEDVRMDNTGYHPGLKKRVKASDYNAEVIIWNADLNRRFIYLHFSEVRVKVGEKINPGDSTGIEGNTGWSTGRHTHLAVISGKSGGTAEDPLVTLGNASVTRNS
ncbi:MAG: ricin-type beta-trefoil lectin domain protein [Potamolinea sp.]